MARRRRQGGHYYADGMQDLPEGRLAILAVCALEWQASLADAVVEAHDRIVGRLYRASERRATRSPTKRRPFGTRNPLPKSAVHCWGHRTMARRWTDEHRE
jgi:hypothetical protein